MPPKVYDVVALTLVAAVLAIAGVRPVPDADLLGVLQEAAIAVVTPLASSDPPPSRRAIAALRRAKRIADAEVNWAGARMLRVGLRDGTMLSIQIIPSKGGGLARTTTDTPPGSKARVAPLKFIALRLPPKLADELLGTGVYGKTGDESGRFWVSTELSTAADAGAKQEQKPALK